MCYNNRQERSEIMKKQRKKSKKNYQTPKIFTDDKQTNVPTIISSDIYSVEDTKLLANLNFFPLIIKGNFENKFFYIGNNEYYILEGQEDIENQEVYACLNVLEFLQNLEIESEAKLLLTGRETLNIHHGRLIEGDIILCTELYNISLSNIIEDTIYMYGKNTQEKPKTKKRK